MDVGFVHKIYHGKISLKSTDKINTGSYCHIVVSILDFESNHLGSNPSNSLYTMPWPSGLRRQIKALVRKSAGSNPVGITVR